MGGLIDTLDDDELATAISTIANVPRERLEQLHDLRGYAERLARLALYSTLWGGSDATDPSETFNLADAHEIEFSTTIDPHNLPVHPEDVFADEAPTIHAVFPTTDAHFRDVFVKWVRIDDSEVLLAQGFPINPRSEQNAIWLTQPTGWQEGRYRVEVFDSELRSLLAAGEYRVDSTASLSAQ